MITLLKIFRYFFEKAVLPNTLGEVISKHQKAQLRIAETEKYPHVTYFFSGGRATPFPGEERILCPSQKVATYDLQPSMSAFDITERTILALEQQKADFICLNFANLDMVGHTGVFDAAVAACEVVDHCLASIIKTVLKRNYMALIVADHGNADTMCNEDNAPHTAHTTNLVPCILVANHNKYALKDGKLADIAPTILECMNIPIPQEMDGQSLLSPF